MGPKYLHTRLEDPDSLKLTLSNTPEECISINRYLGTWINSNGETSEEKRCRVEIATTGFFSMRDSFSNRSFSNENNYCSAYIFSLVNIFHSRKRSVKRRYERRD